MSTASAQPSAVDRFDAMSGSRTERYGKLGADALGSTRARMSKSIMGIGSAVIGAFLVIVVLSQVFQLDILQEMVAPDAANRSAFGNLTAQFVTYGTAAMTLVGIGLIIYGASYAMNMFNGWGGAGGR